MTDPATIVLPILLPLLCGGLLLFFRTRARVQRAGLVISMALNLVGAVILFSRVNRREEPIALNMGGWEVPVGIGFYADLLAAIMILVTAIIAMAGALYALGDIGQTIWKKNYAFFFVLLITGINGAFLTQDLFNLFVWFEVMLIASFAMMILGRRRHTYEGALKYVALNMTSSFFFLSGLGILYGKVGSLNLDNIATVLATSNTDPLILTSAALLLMAFGIKAGVFPLFFWLPASYPHTQFTTAAVFGGLLTKVGVYALFRVFGSALGFLSGITAEFFVIVGILTMLAGVFGAATQFHTRRILSFHIVSQIGYLVLGLGLFTQGAFAAAIFYTAHHIIVKANLFFAAGLIARSGKSERLERVGGILKANPLLAVLFAIPALSLAGIPPLSGFFAKFLLIREAFRSEAYFAAAIAIFVGILTLFSMTKIWSEAFWKDAPLREPKRGGLAIQYVPVAILAAITVLFGIYVDPIFEVSERAAAQLVEASPSSPEPAEPLARNDR